MIQSGKWIKQLQTALQQTGIIYSISRISVYSQKAGRTCTKYIVSAQDQITGKYTPTLQTWRDVDVVTFLADQYKSVHDPRPEDFLKSQGKTEIAEKPPQKEKQESRGKQKSPRKSPGKGERRKAEKPPAKGKQERKAPIKGNP